MENMFCYQCQEAAKGTGCTIKGVCGKDPETANAMDLLIYVVKGIAVPSTELRKNGVVDPAVDHFILDALFCTITNANFDVESIEARITKGVAIKDALLVKAASMNLSIRQTEEVKWAGKPERYKIAAKLVSILTEKNEDIRSLKELVAYGLKGMAAYADHALNLGFNDDEVNEFIQHALAELTRTDISVDELVALTLETGKFGVSAMSLLDKANTNSLW